MRWPAAIRTKNTSEPNGNRSRSLRVLLFVYGNHEMKTRSAGIGSELVGALRQRRKAYGVELKPEYWQLAQKHLREQETKSAQPTIFDLLDTQQPKTADEEQAS